MAQIFPVIMSGGSGTRLWPLSRKHYPKQFLKLIGENTMLQETALRMTGYEEPIIVCNESHRFIVAEQLQEVGVKPTNIILEPIGRNTAPAVALAALDSLKHDPEAILVVLAADHVIKKPEIFREYIVKAVQEAESQSLVTFGIVPDSPETGFGYIQSANKEEMSDILRFVEKPSAAVAQKYLESGEYFWNSGMFVFKASTFLAELKQHNPEMFEAVQIAYEGAQRDLDFLRVPKSLFEVVPDDSIDYAVMEKTSNGRILPIDVGWSDVGSFSALWELQGKSSDGNVSLGDVVHIDSTNCLAQSENQFIATVGLENTVVIGTKDSILVAHKDKVQDVKKVVDWLKRDNRSEHLLHREVHRPWGKYDSVDNGSRYQVKRITVKPGASLSKQMHHHRAEHWIVVSGTAIVEIDEKEQLLTENQSIYIPVGSVHRLTNPGKLSLELIEVQSGSYLGEDDIVRFEDKFGRC